MNDTVINEIILEMQTKIDNSQLIELRDTLQRVFETTKIRKYQIYLMWSYFYRRKK